MTLSEALSVLLAATGSKRVPETTAVVVSVPLAMTRATTTRVTLSPLARSGMVQAPVAGT